MLLFVTLGDIYVINSIKCSSLHNWSKDFLLNLDFTGISGPFFHSLQYLQRFIWYNGGAFGCNILLQDRQQQLLQSWSLLHWYLLWINYYIVYLESPWEPASWSCSLGTQPHARSQKLLTTTALRTKVYHAVRKSATYKHLIICLVCCRISQTDDDWCLLEGSGIDSCLILQIRKCPRAYAPPCPCLIQHIPLQDRSWKGHSSLLILRLRFMHQDW